MDEQPKGTRPNEIFQKMNPHHDGKGRFASGGGGRSGSKSGGTFVGGHGAGSLVNFGEHAKPAGITGDASGWKSPGVQAFIRRFKPGKAVRSREFGTHGVIHQANHTTGMMQVKDRMGLTTYHAKDLVIDGDYSWPKDS